MIFKRERRTYPTVHWQGGRLPGSIRTFCGPLITDKTAHSPDKAKVNCKRCLQCMRRHGHLPTE
jgi:hypothetical protein